MLLLVAPPGGKEALAEAVLLEGWRPQEEFGGMLRFRRLVADGDPPFEGTHFADLVRDRHPFDVAIDVQGDGDMPIPPEGVVDVASRLGHLVDREHSCVLAGTQRRFFGEPTDLGLAYLLVRRPDLSFDQFIKYWSKEHTSLPLPPLRSYRQFYVDPTQTGTLSGQVGLPPGRFDGCAEPYYLDQDEFVQTSLDPDIRQRAASDELNFLDHSGCAVTLFRVESEE
jgi:hypothetical protein